MNPNSPKRSRSRGTVRRILAMQMSGLIHSNFRFYLLEFAGLRMGAGARVLSDVFFSSEKCEIGTGSFINQGCHIDVTAEWVRIGKNVQIGPSVNIITSSHEISRTECRAGKMAAKSVTIEDGCWVGAACTILPGVTVANGCVLAAGTLVRKNTEANGLYAGVPAVLIRKL
jgi:maltose O-acetyltransferase